MRAALAFAAMLAAAPVAAQDLSAGGPVLPPSLPLFFGGPSTVSYTPPTIAVGVVTRDITVPPDQYGQIPQVGNKVDVYPSTAGLLSQTMALDPRAIVISPGVVRVTFRNSGLISVSLAAISLEFWWLGR